MGTRGLLQFIVNGRKLGVHSNWDSYPESMGANIVLFLLLCDLEDCEMMEKNLVLIEWVCAEERKALCVDEAEWQHLSGLGLVDQHIEKSISQVRALRALLDRDGRRTESAKWRDKKLDLERATRGAEIGVCLPHILAGDLRRLVQCDWGEDYRYRIDFAERTLRMAESIEEEQIWGFDELREVDGFWYPMIVKLAIEAVRHGVQQHVLSVIASHLQPPPLRGRIDWALIFEFHTSAERRAVNFARSQLGKEPLGGHARSATQSLMPDGTPIKEPRCRSFVAEPAPDPVTNSGGAELSARPEKEAQTKLCQQEKHTEESLGLGGAMSRLRFLDKLDALALLLGDEDLLPNDKTIRWRLGLSTDFDTTHCSSQAERWRAVLRLGDVDLDTTLEKDVIMSYLRLPVLRRERHPLTFLEQCIASMDMPDYWDLGSLDRKDVESHDRGRERGFQWWQG